MTTNTQAQAAVSKTNSAQTAGDSLRAALKPFDVQHLRGLLEKATPGDWHHRQAGRKDFDWIGDAPEGQPHRKVIVRRHALYGGTPDYALIAAMKTSLPALLDRVEELEARAQAAEARAEKMAEALRAVLVHADDFHPDRDAEAPLALQELRDAVAETTRQALSTGETK